MSQKTWEETWDSFKKGNITSESENPAEYQKVVELWNQHKSDMEWEAGEWIDPPYSKEVLGTLQVDGYSFAAYGQQLSGGKIGCEPDELEGVEVTTPEGKIITLQEKDL
jgi:hypothetical protein